MHIKSRFTVYQKGAREKLRLLAAAVEIIG